MTAHDINGATPPEGPRAIRFPFCGVLSVAAPFLGYFALEIILPCFEDVRHWNWRLFFDGGPSWLQGLAYTIIGCSGLAGLVLGCTALWRAENWAVAVLGLILNAPLILLLPTGLTEFVPEVPNLFAPEAPKGIPVRG
jgi:hypothetical protein